MDSTIKFRLNDEPVNTTLAPGTPVLDFLRKDAVLSGTKEGCREGDCGACAVLVGEADRDGGGARYRALPSCLLALGELRDCHLITIEGLCSGRRDGLTPVMRAFLEENASQCGFCSPGFVIALTAWLANPDATPDLAGAMTAVDGNLCRCTGYGSIRRAASRLVREFAGLPSLSRPRLEALVRLGVLPASVKAFLEEIKGRASIAPDMVCGAVPTGGTALTDGTAPTGDSAPTGPSVALGGGTDWYVRNPDPEPGFSPILLRSLPGFSGIAIGVRNGDRRLELGGALRVSEFFASPTVRASLPGLMPFEHAFASTLIRNLATLGGNIANASPVGDLTSMFMALGTTLEIVALSPDQAPAGQVPVQSRDSARGRPYAPRVVALCDFFLDYKKTELHPGEAIRRIFVPLGQDDANPLRFSFEKAAKRSHLDIAAINTALAFRVSNGVMKDARLSAGGVAPVPRLLEKASSLLEGTRIDTDAPALAALARAVAATAEGEISPIGDVRGSADYRRRMMGRFVLAHFLRLFPGPWSGAGSGPGSESGSGLAEELFP